MSNPERILNFVCTISHNLFSDKFEEQYSDETMCFSMSSKINSEDDRIGINVTLFLMVIFTIAVYAFIWLVIAMLLLYVYY